MVEQDCGARATVRTRVSGTPWVCRPPQLSGAAQSKGLDGVGQARAKARVNKADLDPARIESRLSAPRKLRSRGAKSPPMTKPSLRKPGWVERRKARVSLSGGRDALRCCREAASETKTLRFAALRPPRCGRGPQEYGRTRRRLKNTGDDACL